MIELHFLPYGRVDAILIGVDGHWLFVDGGYRRDGKKAVEYMRGLGISRLDAYIATHRHRNHVGAGPYIITKMMAKYVYSAHPDMWKRLYELCQTELEMMCVDDTPCMVLHVGDSFQVGQALFACIGPSSMRKCTSGAYKENYNSLILRLEYLGRTVLLTGDTSGSILGKCLDDTTAEVLKNPHHNGAVGEKLLKRIGARFTVVCNGKPPAKYYQKRLEAAGSKLLTAGKKGDGLVIMEGGENGWKVRPT